MTKRCQESVGIEEKFVYKNEYVPVDLGTGIRANSPSKQTVWTSASKNERILLTINKQVLIE